VNLSSIARATCPDPLSPVLCSLCLIAVAKDAAAVSRLVAERAELASQGGALAQDVLARLAPLRAAQVSHHTDTKEHADSSGSSQHASDRVY
jgi:hypothetical protein